MRINYSFQFQRWTDGCVVYRGSLNLFRGLALAWPDGLVCLAASAGYCHSIQFNSIQFNSIQYPSPYTSPMVDVHLSTALLVVLVAYIVWNARLAPIVAAQQLIGRTSWTTLLGACVRACEPVRVRTCMFVCGRACMHACMCAGVHACVRACMHACLRVRMHVCVCMHSACGAMCLQCKCTLACKAFIKQGTKAS